MMSNLTSYLKLQSTTFSQNFGSSQSCFISLLFHIIYDVSYNLVAYKTMIYYLLLFTKM